MADMKLACPPQRSEQEWLKCGLFVLPARMALRLKRKSEGNRPGSGKKLKELTDGTTGESVPLLPDAAKFVESMQAWLPGGPD